MTRALGWVIALVLALAAGAVVTAGSPPAPGAAAPDEGCPSDYPTLIAPGTRETTYYSRALRGLIVCSNPMGTATLFSNRTDAVWVLEEPSHVGLHRLPSSSLSDSFVRLVASPSPAIPSGTAIVVPRAPSEVRVRVNAELTLAQLAHDQLAGSLALDASGGHVLARYGGLLGECLGLLIAEIESPEAVLASGNPAPHLIEAAQRLAASRGTCPEVWRAVGGGSLEDDVAGWRRHAGFAVRAVSAAITYRALLRQIRVVEAP
ncbi:hypothetical protein [Naasia sp. SYSU D00948]|uniref:hypothetical protein n=1 Tax=Naasia sp. SYSU D00948 TaxID=2817379 RepID=UPI001B30D97C|nr:hypothetical protein [Naasia sp. SYSU D00948]